jgi:hypothetical protein
VGLRRDRSVRCSGERSPLRSVRHAHVAYLFECSPSKRRSGRSVSKEDRARPRPSPRASHHDQGGRYRPQCLTITPGPPPRNSTASGTFPWSHSHRVPSWPLSVAGLTSIELLSGWGDTVAHIVSAGNLGASLLAPGEEANHAESDEQDGDPTEHDRRQRHYARARTADPRSDTCQ